MNRWNLWTFPNALSFFRFGVAFWLIITMAVQHETVVDVLPIARALLIVAFLTDYFDGWIARRWKGQQSKVGTYIDPPADKLVVCSAMIYLVMIGAASGFFEYACFGLIILREVFMWSWRMVRGADLYPVTGWGKWKTVLQMAALTLYLFVPSAPELYGVAALALISATILTLWSLVQYLVVPRHTPAA